LVLLGKEKIWQINKVKKMKLIRHRSNKNKNLIIITSATLTSFTRLIQDWLRIKQYTTLVSLEKHNFQIYRILHSDKVIHFLISLGSESPKEILKNCSKIVLPGKVKESPYVISFLKESELRKKEKLK
jgi:hypothetical protein